MHSGSVFLKQVGIPPAEDKRLSVARGVVRWILRNARGSKTLGRCACPRACERLVIVEAAIDGALEMQEEEATADADGAVEVTRSPHTVTCHRCSSGNGPGNSFADSAARRSSVCFLNLVLEVLCLELAAALNSAMEDWIAILVQAPFLRLASCDAKPNLRDGI